jgi:hypothetical protein
MEMMHIRDRDGLKERIERDMLYDMATHLRGKVEKTVTKEPEIMAERWRMECYVMSPTEFKMLMHNYREMYDLLENLAYSGYQFAEEMLTMVKEREDRCLQSKEYPR